MLLLTSGLLALLTLSSAGGDHIKGGGHIKGAGTHIVPEQIHQEDANLNLKTVAAFTPKTIISTGPNIVPGHQGVIQFREPIARPVIDQAAIATVKTSPPVVALHDDQHSIKTISEHSIKQPIAHAPVIPSRAVVSGHSRQSVHAIGGAAPTALNSAGQLSGGAREVIVYDDGRIEEVGGGAVDLGQISYGTRQGDSVYSSGVTTRVGGAPTDGQRVRKPAGLPVRTVPAVSQRRPAVIPSSPVRQPLPMLQAGEDIISLNKKLIEKQNQEDLKKTLYGVVDTGSDIGRVSLSTGELEEISRRLGTGVSVSGVPKVETPLVVPQVQRTLVRQRTPATVTRITSVPKPSIIVQPQVGEDIVTLNRQLIERQNQEDLRHTLSGVVKADSAISGASLSSGELSEVARRLGGQIRNPAISVQEVKKPAVLTRVKPVVVQQRTPALPKPQISPPYIPQPQITSPQVGADIITLNRQLIEKQNQEDLRRTLSGVVKVDSDIGRVSLSDGDVGQIYRRLSGGVSGYGVHSRGTYGIAGTPARISPYKPAVVRQPISSAVRPNAIIGTVGGDRLKYTPRVSSTQIGGAVRTRLTGVQPGSISQSGNYFILGNTVGSIGGFRYGAQSPAVPRQQVNTYALPRPKAVAPVLPKVPAPARPQISAPAIIQPQLGEDLISINKRLIEKQNEEDLKHTLSGVVRADGDISGVSLSTVELDEISRRLLTGHGSPGGPSLEISRPVDLPRIQPVAVRQRIPIVPQPQRLTPVVPLQPVSIPQPVVPAAPLENNIILLNRQLIEKQNQEDLKQTLSGVVTTGADIGAVSLSSGELEEISRRLSGSVGGISTNEIRAPVEVPRPVMVRQRIPAAVRPQISTIRGPGPGLAYGGRISSGLVSGPEVRTRPLSPSIPVEVSPRRPTPITVHAQPEAGLSDDIITLNRNLIDKQTDESFLQTLRGVVKADSDLDGVSVSAEELRGISHIVGYNVGGPGVGLGSRSGAGISGSRNVPGIIGLSPAAYAQHAVSQDHIEPAIVVQDHNEPSVVVQENVEPAVPAVSVVRKPVRKVIKVVKESIVRFSPVEQPKVSQIPIAATVSGSQFSRPDQPQIIHRVGQQKLEQILV